ncbi:MAG: amidohydrolase family protein [Chloroflexi bacterium OLB13]|nr:MAG: amidohydrolase family protein [Chloroflexi bacterium OLB13]
MIHPDDVGRLARMHVIASIQPIHAVSDIEMADAYWGERARLAYNARVQIDLGAPVAFGSDSPVDTFDPVIGLYAAVARRRASDGAPGPDGWYPENRLTLDEALRGYTEGPAYAAGMEQRLGRLTAGYLADLVVWDRDLFDIPLDELPHAQVVGTMTGGVWRFGGV